MTPRGRMRAGVLLAAWAVWVGAASPAGAAPPDWAPWAHVADVHAPAAPAGGLVELPLPVEVLAKARSDLGDLRLASEGGLLVPYVLRTDRGQAGESVAYEPKRLFNRTAVPGQRSSVTVDFGGRARRTDIDVDTPGTNFRRRVLVEAGQDGRSWQELRKTAWLFRMDQDGARYDRRRVVLGDNDFRFLRVTVFHGPDDGEDVPIRGVRARYLKSVPPRTVDVPVRSTDVSQKPRIKATEVHVDLGHENLPLHDVRLSFADASFLRRVEVLGRNRAKRTVTERVEGGSNRRRDVDVPWRHLAAGTIHRFPSPPGEGVSESLSLRVPGRCRYLLVRVHNGDDAPLTLTGVAVRRLAVHLAFAAQGAAPRRLYVGNPAAGAPEYDLARYADRLRAEGIAAATLAAVTTNPLHAAQTRIVPWSERHAGVLWGVLLVVLAVLAILVARQGRHARSVKGS